VPLDFTLAAHGVNSVPAAAAVDGTKVGAATDQTFGTRLTCWWQKTRLQSLERFILSCNGAWLATV
jgi:hypothetical protein